MRRNFYLFLFILLSSCCLSPKTPSPEDDVLVKKYYISEKFSPTEKYIISQAIDTWKGTTTNILDIKEVNSKYRVSIK